MITRVTQEDIDNAFERFKRNYQGVKQDYFGVMFIAKKFGLKSEDVLQNYLVALGGNDYAIDGYYFDEERRNLYLYQFKWSIDYGQFRQSFERLIKDGVERIFGSSNQDTKQNQVLIGLKSCLMENKDIINKVFVNFVFNGDPAKAEQSKVLDSLREDLETKILHKMSEFFGRNVDYVFQFISNQRTMGRLITKKELNQYSIECKKEKLSFKSGENDLMVMFIPLSKLLIMYNDLGEKLFNKNIRSGLGEGKATNREIHKSLREIISGTMPEGNFTFYHNGISITAEDIHPSENGLILVEPRVLNGAQTIKTLHNFVEKFKADDRVADKLKLIKIMARIIKSYDEDFLTNVTINNNRQNPIEPWNLRANDLTQLHFEDKFNDREEPIYYERRESAFENLSSEERQELGVGEKIVEITKFAKTLLACQGATEKMSRIGEVFENDNYYKDTFREHYFSVNTEKLLLFYKISYRLNSISWEIRGMGENKYYYATRATNLIWALLIQGLLNDDRFDEYVEKYGASLLMEGDYNGILKDIASKKIRLIFSKTFATKKYRNYLEEEKFSFLRSRSTYDDCMETARKKYRWKKINI